jgi:hypothetical protein
MASSSKKKTTFAKLNREAAVRERRQIKEARRAARKLGGDDAPAEVQQPVDDRHPDLLGEIGEIDENGRPVASSAAAKK